MVGLFVVCLHEMRRLLFYERFLISFLRNCYQLNRPFITSLGILGKRKKVKEVI